MFHLATSRGEMAAPALVIATGGASYPHLGATSDGLVIAKQFGHKIIPAHPALVPFNLSPRQMEPLRCLQGISLPAAVTVGSQTFTDDLLFTHFGLSGPAILQTSLYWVKNQPLTINLLPQTDLFSLLKNQQTGTKNKVGSVLKNSFPNGWRRGFLTEMTFGWPRPEPKNSDFVRPDQLLADHALLHGRLSPCRGNGRRC